MSDSLESRSKPVTETPHHIPLDALEFFLSTHGGAESVREAKRSNLTLVEKLKRLRGIYDGVYSPEARAEFEAQLEEAPPNPSKPNSGPSS